MDVSYFTQPKAERDVKAARPASAPEPAAPAAAAKGSPEIVSTFGHGMLVTGNVVCTGALQVFGRVVGEIHASHLVVCEGAKVDGKITAQEVVVQGEFKGTIHGNSIKLMGTASVDGEVFNKSLTIEPNVQFEGVSRRLDQPVEPPTADQVNGVAPALAPAAPVYSAPAQVAPAPMASADQTGD